MATVLPKTVAELLEKEFEQQVIGSKKDPGLARMLGYRVYHTLHSKGSEPGYPDWTLVRRGRLVFLECKREKGIVSDAQKEWVGALHDTGIEVYVIRPKHLDAVAQVLSALVDPRGMPTPLGEVARALDADTLREIGRL